MVVQLRLEYRLPGSNRATPPFLPERNGTPTMSPASKGHLEKICHFIRPATASVDPTLTFNLNNRWSRLNTENCK